MLGIQSGGLVRETSPHTWEGERSGATCHSPPRGRRLWSEFQSVQEHWLRFLHFVFSPCVLFFSFLRPFLSCLPSPSFSSLLSFLPSFIHLFLPSFCLFPFPFSVSLSYFLLPLPFFLSFFFFSKYFLLLKRNEQISKQTKSGNKPINTENELMVQEEWRSKMDEEERETQLPVMKWMCPRNKSHSIGNIVNGFVTVLDGDRWQVNLWAQHNFKSLRCAHETNLTLCVPYNSILLTKPCSYNTASGFIYIIKILLYKSTSFYTVLSNVLFFSSLYFT